MKRERAKNIEPTWQKKQNTFEAKFSAKQAANYSNFYQIFGSLKFNIFDLNSFFQRNSRQKTFGGMERRELYSLKLSHFRIFRYFHNRRVYLHAKSR
jgi:hypothetical protein